jgi:peptidyl-prolyl cis-trans isomerase D
MLQSLHNTATSFFVKLLMVLLVASFALWGIGDIFRTSPASEVVSVGDGSVSALELQQALDEEVMNYRRMLGDQYTPDLLKTIGIPNQVLDKLVQQHLVEAELRAQGLAAPDSHLLAQLRDNPAFQNDERQFDADRFRAILAANNLTEAAYLDLLAKEASADMLMQSVFSGVRATKTAAHLAYLYENEQRTADLLLFRTGLVKQVEEPSTLELERFYEEYADNFKAQEHRVFSLVALDQQAMQQTLSLSDEDLLIEYQNRIDEFRDPEKREVRQLLFDDESTAQKAVAALDAGQPLEEVAKSLGATNDSLLLGNVTASGLLPEAEKPVFALPSGGHTQPIQSSFGWHVFQVTGIEPEHTRPLSEVKEQLSKELRALRVGEEAYALSNTLQDDLAGGATLEEAAQSIDTTVQTFGPISADGTSPDGTPLVLPPSYPNLLVDAFNLKEGEVSPLTETDDGSYYALRVDSVMPERTRALDEIKGQVIHDWKAAQKEKALYQLATTAAESLSGSSASAVAAKTGATLKTNQTFTRSSTQLDDETALPAMMLSALFAAEEGAATEVYALPDGNYVVARLTAIKKADDTGDDAQQGIAKAQENLRAVYADDLYLQYMAYLRSKHHVSEPNQALIDSLLK